MKRLFSIFLIFTQLYVFSNAARAVIPFGDVGRFYDVLPRAHPLHIANAIDLLESGRLLNYRMYADTDTTPPEGWDFPNQIEKLRIMGYRGEGKHDIPQCYRALCAERLFPCPDGTALVPNQGSTLDPVRAFTPQVIGAILNYLSGFYGVGLDTKEAEIEYAQGLAFQIDRLLNPRNKWIGLIFDEMTNKRYREDLKTKRAAQKVHKPIFDFALSLVRALQEQRISNDLWEPYFIEKSLMAFALLKAAGDEDLHEVDGTGKVGPVDSHFVRNMKSFYEAMPKICPAPAYENPFTYDEYKAIVARVKQWAEDQEEESTEEEETPSEGGSESGEVGAVDEADPVRPEPMGIDLSPRELFILLFGLKSFAQVFPTQHFYSTTEYEGIKFSNCGETSLLNLINCFLWDFEDKRLRVEILQRMGDVVSPALLDFYHRFSTPSEQMRRAAQMAWTAVVSNLCEFDPYIVYKKGDKTCEITGSIPSMMGVVRALFRDEGFRAIARCDSCGPADKVRATLDHLVELFSREGEDGAREEKGPAEPTPPEVWTWRNAEGKEGEDPHQLGVFNAKIAFYKEGDNCPVVDDCPLEGPLMTWDLAKGHFDCGYSTSESPEYMEVFAKRLLRHMVDYPAAFADTLNRWCVGSYAEIVEEIGASYCRERGEDDEPLHPAITERLRTPEQARTFLQLSIMNKNYRSVENQIFAFWALSGGKSPVKASHLYRMAANVLELIPRGDLHAILSVLPSLLGGGDELPALEALPDIHPRVTQRMREILQEIRDPMRACECLQRFSAFSNVSICLLRIMAEGVARGDVCKEDVLKVLHEHSEEDESTSEFWTEFFDMYQRDIVEEGEGLNPEELMLYRVEEDSMSVLENFLEEAKDDVVDMLLQRGLITKDMLLALLRDVPNMRVFQYSESVYLPFPHCTSMSRLANLLEHLRLTAAEVSEAYPDFLPKLIEAHIHCKSLGVDLGSVLRILDILGVSMVTPLKAGEGTVGIAIVQQDNRDLLELCQQTGRMTKEVFLAAFVAEPKERYRLILSLEDLRWVVDNLGIGVEDLEGACPGFIKENLDSLMYNCEEFVSFVVVLGMGLDTIISPEQGSVADLIIKWSSLDYLHDCIERGLINKDHFFAFLRNRSEGADLPYIEKGRFVVLIRDLKITPEELGPYYIPLISNQVYNLETVEDVWALLSCLGIDLLSIVKGETGQTILQLLVCNKPLLYSHLVEEGSITRESVLTALRLLNEGELLIFPEDLRTFAASCRTLGISVEDIEEVRPNFFSCDACHFEGDARVLFKMDEKGGSGV